jgi:hypothetical protein
MVMRTETPDTWFTSGLLRAARVISPTISAMNSGTATSIPATSGSAASWRAIASSTSRLAG